MATMIVWPIRQTNGPTGRDMIWAQRKRCSLPNVICTSCSAVSRLQRRCSKLSSRGGPANTLLGSTISCAWRKQRVEVDESQADLLRELSTYYIQSRYPEEIPDLASKVRPDEAKRILVQTEGFLQWLSTMR